jgi:hypothetical protein
MSSTAYTSERRSRAAKWGWAFRRSPVEDTPGRREWRRAHELIRTIDFRVGHLFICDSAEALLPFHVEAHPTDTRPQRALAIARRYAEGQATPNQRRYATRLIQTFWDERGMDRIRSDAYTKADNAVQVISFALCTRLDDCLYWGSFWAYQALHGDLACNDRHAFHLELIAELEALEVLVNQQSE